ncbi:MAG TPA: GNAT family N-acetyltransferase [Deinococcales bacterium]|nr:GNAT family N-acetyltransferase [Deinococcales bacterium]
MTTPQPPVYHLRPVDEETYTAAAHDVALPIEQDPIWDRFDAVVEGRKPWLRLLLSEDEQTVAVIALTLVEGPGPLRHLWAKNGPVWLVEPTSRREAALRQRLAAAARRTDPRIAFIRLHAQHEAADLQPVMTGITYDRTVVVDLQRSEEEIFAGMKQQGRRAIRKALKDETLSAGDETEWAVSHFDELYEIFLETGQREGFGPHPAQRYLAMLTTLGPAHARVFVTRREGRALAWALVLLNDGAALYSVGASNSEARGAYAADLLHWRIIETLAREGADSYDLAGAGSERFPGLGGLTQFKTKFERHITDVAPAWDRPIRPVVYRGLVEARRVKHGLSQLLGKLRSG